MPGAAQDFRAIADGLARQGAALVGEDPPQTDRLVQIATAGKAAMEASQAARLGPSDVERMLAAMADELEAVDLLEAAEKMDVEDFLKLILGTIGKLARSNDPQKMKALEQAYKLTTGRLLQITEQAEAANNATSTRVAQQNRRAIDESVVTLERAGLSVPVTAARS